jgi:outer membrane protein, adhesin transport system
MTAIQATALKRCTRVFAIALGLAGFASSHAAAESLQSVVEHALQTNPELAAIRSNRKAIDFELDAARGLYLPSVDIKSETGRERNGRTSGLGIESNNDWHKSREVSGVVSQRLFDGFEARHEVARHRNRVESARWRVADTANSIALRAIQAYLEIQRSHAVLNAARSNLTQLQALQSRVQSRVSAGRGTAGENSEAAARVASAQAVVAEAANRLADAEALFRAVVGKPAGQLGPVTAPRKALPSNVEGAVGQATAAAPSVLATQFDAVAAEASVGTATSRLFPKLNFELSADRGWGTTERNDKDHEARAMFVVRWNLFNGGIDKARIHEAKARAIEATEISFNTQRIIEREVRVSWNAVAAADQRVPALQRQVDANRQTRSTYSAQFETGQRRLLDLLDIQNELFVAEASLYTERFVGTYNVYRVLAGTGRLVEALGLAAPAEAVTGPAAHLIESWRHNYYSWATIIEYHRAQRHTVKDVSIKDAPAK